MKAKPITKKKAPKKKVSNKNVPKKKADSRWSQISDDYDDDDGMIRIDAWVTENGNEEGKIIAKINEETLEVEYIDKRAKTDKYAQEIIKAILEDLKE